MNIGFDGRVLLRKHKTGVDYYTLGLLRAVTRIMPEAHFNISYFGSLSSDIGVDGPNLSKHPRGIITDRIYNVLNRLGIAPPYDRLTNNICDIFIFPDFVIPPLANSKNTIVIIHDVAFQARPEFSTPRHREYLRKFVPRSIQNATAVIAISASTKQAIIDAYGTDPEKIVVIPPGVDTKRFTPQAGARIEAVKKRYGIKGSYILGLGTLEPRKNVNGLIEAYAKLPTNLKDTTQLVLAGGKGWLDQEILEALEASDKNIFATGYVDEQDLPALYSGASLFVYPSFYEGFGMPPLEAMACGIPVITGNNSSLPEAVGNAGIMIQAEDTLALSSAIENLLTNPSERERLAQAGLERVRQFSWEKSAQAFKTLVKGI